MEESNQAELPQRDNRVTEVRSKSEYEGLANKRTEFIETVIYQGTKGRGMRHVVYWKHTNEAGVQPLKVNLIIYDNDVLQVSI